MKVIQNNGNKTVTVGINDANGNLIKTIKIEPGQARYIPSGCTATAQTEPGDPPQQIRLIEV